AGEIARIIDQLRGNLVAGDRGRDVPIGIDDDVLDLVAEHRRLVAGGADDDAGGVDRTAVLDDVEPELRNVDGDVEVPEIRRGPTPALHIGDDVFLARGRAAIERRHRCRADNAIS